MNLTLGVSTLDINLDVEPWNKDSILGTTQAWAAALDAYKPGFYRWAGATARAKGRLRQKSGRPRLLGQKFGRPRRLDPIKALASL